MSYGPHPWVQAHWDERAAANFILGGTGSGLLVAGLFSTSSGVILSSLALIGLGLAAVWLEIGRKLRAAHVFFNPRTSWMTRESYAAVLVFSSGIFSMLEKAFLFNILAALAALAFLWCQAQILRAAKGIPAWRAPQVVALIVATGLAEGSALLLLLDMDITNKGFFVAALLARDIAWSRYWRALKQPGSRAALEPAGKFLLQLGTVAPLALLLAGIFLPQATFLAGLLALAAGWRLKFVLVARAAFNQGFSLEHLPAR